MFSNVENNRCPLDHLLFSYITTLHYQRLMYFLILHSKLNTHTKIFRFKEVWNTQYLKGDVCSEVCSLLLLKGQTLQSLYTNGNKFPPHHHRNVLSHSWSIIHPLTLYLYTQYIGNTGGKNKFLPSMNHYVCVYLIKKYKDQLCAQTLLEQSLSVCKHLSKADVFHIPM